MDILVACDRLHLFCACIRRSDEKLKELFSQSRWTTVVLKIFSSHWIKVGPQHQVKKNVYDLWLYVFQSYQGTLTFFKIGNASNASCVPLFFVASSLNLLGFALRMQLKNFMLEFKLRSPCPPARKKSTFWAVVQNLGSRASKPTEKSE